MPNGERFQQVSQDLVGIVMANPNKPETVDNRQTANYLITNLQKNDFSIYQRPHLRGNKQDLDFFIDSNAQDYSGISTESVKLEKLPKHNLKHGEQNVYTPNEYNPNLTILHNTIGQQNPNVENPLLFQQRKANNSAAFMGKGYPGTAINANRKDNNERIFLDTDSILSSQYLDFFSPNGCLNNQCGVF